jgi:hypothetical protein
MLAIGAVDRVVTVATLSETIATDLKRYCNVARLGVR